MESLLHSLPLLISLLLIVLVGYTLLKQKIIRILTYLFLAFVIAASWIYETKGFPATRKMIGNTLQHIGNSLAATGTPLKKSVPVAKTPIAHVASTPARAVVTHFPIGWSILGFAIALIVWRVWKNRKIFDVNLKLREAELLFDNKDIKSQNADDQKNNIINFPSQQHTTVKK